MLPLWTSVLVRTYAWMVLLGRNGIINRMLIDSGLHRRRRCRCSTASWPCMLGMVHVMLPFMILPIYSARDAHRSRICRRRRAASAHPRCAS